VNDESGRVGPYCFKLEALHINRLIENRVEVIEKELNALIGIFENNSDSLELRHDVNLSIYLTDQMAECVDKVRKDYGMKNITPYEPMRNSVAAFGITLYHPERPPLNASIVFNQEPWMQDYGENIVLRTYLVYHEIGHVLQEARGSGVNWHNKDRTVMPYAETVQRLPAILRDEFVADIIAGDVCNAILRNDKNQPIWPSEIMGPWFIDSVHQLMGNLCDFARHDVQNYRVTGIGLEGLLPKVAPLITELFLVLAHVAALYAQADKMDLLRTAMENINGFSSLVAEDWDAFLKALAKEDGADAEAEIIRIFDAVLSRLGLRIDDLPGGNLYIHVHEPVI
jgi:hypothetical protein